MSQALDAGGSFDAGGSHFSFAAPVAGKGDGQEGEGGEVYGTWIQKVRGRYGYFTRSSDLIKQQGARRKGGAAAMEGGEPKGVGGRPEVGRLGDAWPPPVLGKNARPRRLVMPAVYPSSSLQSSQAAMARYRQEMMELVRGVPESAYELSLRDLVEVPRMAAAPTQEEEEEEKAGSKERGGRGGGPDQVVVAGREKKVKSGKKKIIPRSTSVDGGVFLLKMFFPPSLGWRRRSSSSSKGAKVSPKPVMAEAEKRGAEKDQVDTEWLERSGEKSTRDETKNNGQRRKGIGCYPFSLNKGRIRYDVGMNQENDI